MSIYKRVSGNLVVQTVGNTDSITFQGLTANTATVIIDGNLTVSGNVALTGNISGDKLFNGTTSIEIPTASGNANITVSGVSNVFVATSTGIAVAGTASASGNVTGANINTAGLVSATGNVNGGNLNITTGNIVLTRASTATTSPTIQFTDSNTAVSSLGANIGSFEWFTSDATGAGPRVTAAVKAVYADAGGNANVLIQTASGASLTNRIVVLGATGNVGVANSAPLHTLAVTGTMYGSSTLDIVGNVAGGNVSTAGLVTATGNVTGANINTGGLITATGNISGGNISVAGGVIGGAGGVSVTGNVTGGNLIINGTMSASGNLTTTNISATTLDASANITGGNIKTTGISNVGTSIVTGTQTVTGNITGANVNTGILSASGNILGLNVNTGLVSATGNVVSGAGGFFIGDGGFLSNVTVASNIAATQLANGTSNWAIRTSGGDITGDVGGSANVAILTGSGFSLTGFMSAAGNVTGANINTGGLISATGNIIGGNVSGTTGTFTTVIGNANATSLTTGTVPSDRLTGQYSINITGSAVTANSVTINAQPNITSVGTLTVLSVSGNITGGNLNTGAQVIATGNITGGNITTAGQVSVTGNIVGSNIEISGSIRDSSQLDLTTTAGNIVLTPAAGSNVQVAANANITATTISTTSATGALVVAGGAGVAGNVYVGGLISATGNITGGNILGGANVNATTLTGTTVSVTGNITGGNLLTGGLISATANITGSNVNTGGLVSATGNIVGGNVTTAGLITATGNITGAFIIGDGSLLSSITGANVTGTVSSATSATTAGTVTTAAQPNITSVGTLTVLSVGTGNITGGNLLISGSILDSGQLDIQTTAGNANIVLTPNGIGNVNIGSNIMPTANATANIGSATSSFNTVFAQATSAQYADLAEKFRADAAYQPGTVLIFGGTQEVTISTQDTDRRVAGVVSTNPSYLMNSGLNDELSVAIALQGRVPCRVVGPVRKGDMMVSASNGHAKTHQDPPTGSIIGKSLENFDGETGIIEIVVGRD
jgi:fibronectin-binding autotransporter adhesin